MFERAVEDPSENAVRRLVGLFRVAAVGLVANGVLFVLTEGLGNVVAAALFVGISLLFAVGTWMTAQGIEERKPSARNWGFVIAFLSLFSLGIGTIFGLIELYSPWRAQRGGQFNAGNEAIDLRCIEPC